MAKTPKTIRETWYRCPKTGMVVSRQVCNKCDDKGKCGAEEVERKIRLRV